MTDPGLRRLALAAMVPGFVGTTVPDWLADALADGLGGVCLFAHNVENTENVENVASLGQVRALCDRIHELSSDAVVMADEEGGMVSRLDAGAGSPWPTAAALGALDDPEATYAVGLAVGERACSAGIDLVLAPVLDVNSEPENPVIGVRSFGPGVEPVVRHGVAFARGLADAGVAGCGKHFPGHGATRTDSHLALPSVTYDESTWRRVDLPPFAAAVEAGLPAVMTAHVVLGCLDDRPATISRRVLDVLRSELGFGGVVVSDALDMRAISAGMGREAGAVRALAAGVDLLCIGNPVFPERYDERAVLESLVEAVCGAVAAGELDTGRLEAAAARVAALPRPAQRPEPTPREELVEAAVETAARTLTVTGDVRLGPGGWVVVTPDGANMAAGPVDSPLATELRERGLQVVGTRAEAPAGQEPVEVRVGLEPPRDGDGPAVHTRGMSAATAVAVARLVTGA